MREERTEHKTEQRLRNCIAEILRCAICLSFEWRAAFVIMLTLAINTHLIVNTCSMQLDFVVIHLYFRSVFSSFDSAHDCAAEKMKNSGESSPS